jgi:hypothetical protein
MAVKCLNHEQNCENTSELYSRVFVINRHLKPEAANRKLGHFAVFESNRRLDAEKLVGRELRARRKQFSYRDKT